MHSGYINPTSPEWRDAQETLRRLSLREIQALAHALGMRFTVNGHNPLTKEDYIGILDETTWEEFNRELSRILTCRDAEARHRKNAE